MNMQDNEMDNLFRSKLEGLEMEPSAGVWSNISNELDGDRKRRVWVPYLSVAAAVVVMVSAGLLFWPKDKTNGKPGLVATRHNPKPSVDHQQHEKSAQPKIDSSVRQIASTQTKQLIPAAHRTVFQPQVKSVSPQAMVEPKNENTPVPQQTYALVDNLQKAEPKAVVPDVKFANQPVTDVPVVGSKQQPVMAMVQTPGTDTKQQAASTVKKHKIRGLGSLINAAVALVDTRDDKIITFADTDEGDTVTGINLGIIKVKKVE